MIMSLLTFIEVMVERKLPIHIIRLLRNLLKKKKLVFYVEGIECMSHTGYKGSPQGSILSPFLYSLLGSGVDRFIPAGCGILQYTDDVVGYASHRIMEFARALVQMACSAIKVFFYMVGSTISAVKCEAMAFSINYHKPDVTLWVVYVVIKF
jgi:hypothetical protein